MKSIIVLYFVLSGFEAFVCAQVETELRLGLGVSILESIALPDRFSTSGGLYPFPLAELRISFPLEKKLSGVVALAGTSRGWSYRIQNIPGGASGRSSIKSICTGLAAMLNWEVYSVESRRQLTSFQLEIGAGSTYCYKYVYKYPGEPAQNLSKNFKKVQADLLFGLVINHRRSRDKWRAYHISYIRGLTDLSKNRPTIKLRNLNIGVGLPL